MISRKVAFAAVAVLAAWAAFAQGNVAQSAAQTVQVVQSRAANAALMKQYTWNERIDFLVNGQQKDLRIDLVATTSIPGNVLKQRLRVLAGSGWTLTDVTAG